MSRRRTQGGGTFAVVTGGGTGGHVSPALAVGEALVERGHPPHTIHFVGARRGIERTLVPEAGFPLTLLPGRGIVRRLSLANLGSLAGIAVACISALVLLLRLRPSVVLTVGGYAGFPASLAAVLLGIPLIAVHLDAVPGAANRLVARRAAANAVAFARTPLPRATVTGAPLRGAVLSASREPGQRHEVRHELGLDEQRPLVLVTGGSLGAGSLNTAVLEWCSARTKEEVSVYHVAGERNLSEVRARALAAGLIGTAEGTSDTAGWAGHLDYRVVGFERRLPSLLGACDVAVARAGASTVAELAAIGVPSVLVPLPGAPGDHQSANASTFAEAGAAVVLPDSRCSGAGLAKVLDPLLADGAKREAMAQAARALGHRDAADRVAALAESVARSRR